MMKANPSKFQFMLMDRKNRCTDDLQICVNGSYLSPVKSVKLLGINIDAKLILNDHVSGLCKKANKNLNIMTRLSGRIKGTKERIALLDAFLMSSFSYCPTSWHFCGRSVETKMENLHERGLRFVMNDFTRSYQELLNITNCDTMILWRLKKIAVFMFKCLNGHNPKYLCDMFSAKGTSYEFRDGIRIEPYKFKTKTYGYKSLLYAGAKLWNSLPVFMKISSNVNEFKMKLCDWKCSNMYCMKCKEYEYCN